MPRAYPRHARTVAAGLDGSSSKPSCFRHQTHRSVVRVEVVHNYSKQKQGSDRVDNQIILKRAKSNLSVFFSRAPKRLLGPSSTGKRFDVRL